MVGDVKQSIYRFRLAEPALFIHKHETYAKIDDLNVESASTEGIKIDLSSNFRSRRTVLDGVNYLFEQTMDKEVGDVTYDESQSLQYGNIHYDDQASDYDPEVYVVEAPSDANDEETLTKVEQEAQLVANKIQRLIHEAYPVFDKQTKATRPVEYRDFAILMRSLPSAPIYLDVFKRAGIPVYSDRDEGYFRRVEVQVMLSLLRVIDNPYQDIPLASVLRSPIVGLREHELAEIRLQAVGQPFF
nr:3'-5' exonuclease [Geomicrobium sp. JCM 19055]